MHQLREERKLIYLVFSIDFFDINCVQLNKDAYFRMIQLILVFRKFCFEIRAA